MTNTFTQIYLQLVFAVQDGVFFIEYKWKNEIYYYTLGILQTNNHKLIAINSITNHIHILSGFKVHQLILPLLQDIKDSSSKRINKRGIVRGKLDEYIVPMPRAAVIFT